MAAGIFSQEQSQEAADVYRLPLNPIEIYMKQQGHSRGTISFLNCFAVFVLPSWLQPGG